MKRMSTKEKGNAGKTEGNTPHLNRCRDKTKTELGPQLGPYACKKYGNTEEEEWRS